MEDPVARLACIQREFGEHGGVNPSVEISTTFSGVYGAPCTALGPAISSLDSLAFWLLACNISAPCMATSMFYKDDCCYVSSGGRFFAQFMCHRNDFLLLHGCSP